MTDTREDVQQLLDQATSYGHSRDLLEAAARRWGEGQRAAAAKDAQLLRAARSTLYELRGIPVPERDRLGRGPKITQTDCDCTHRTVEAALAHLEAQAEADAPDENLYSVLLLVHHYERTGKHEEATRFLTRGISSTQE